VETLSPRQTKRQLSASKVIRCANQPLSTE